MTETLTLPARLDLTAARTLTEALRAQEGRDLTLDASGVEAMGGLGLQVLLAAGAHWRAAGHALGVAPRSEAFDLALAQFGVPLTSLEVPA